MHCIIVFVCITLIACGNVIKPDPVSIAFGSRRRCFLAIGPTHVQKIESASVASESLQWIYLISKWHHETLNRHPVIPTDAIVAAEVLRGGSHSLNPAIGAPSRRCPPMPSMLRKHMAGRLRKCARGLDLYGSAREAWQRSVSACIGSVKSPLIQRDTRSILLVSEVLQEMELEVATYEVMLAAGLLQPAVLDSTRAPNTSCIRTAADHEHGDSTRSLPRGDELLTMVRDAIRREAEGPCVACSPSGGPAGPVMQTFHEIVAGLPGDPWWSLQHTSIDRGGTSGQVQLRALSRASSIVRRLLLGLNCQPPYVSGLRSFVVERRQNASYDMQNVSADLCTALPAVLAIAQPAESHSHVQFPYRTARLEICRPDGSTLEPPPGALHNTDSLERWIDSNADVKLCYPARGPDTILGKGQKQGTADDDFSAVRPHADDDVLLTSPRLPIAMHGNGQDSDARAYCSVLEDAARRWMFRREMTQAARSALACIGPAAAHLERQPLVDRSGLANASAAILPQLHSCINQLKEALHRQITTHRASNRSRQRLVGQACPTETTRSIQQQLPLAAVHQATFSSPKLSFPLMPKFQPGNAAGLTIEDIVALSTPRWTPPMRGIRRHGLRWNHEMVEARDQNVEIELAGIVPASLSMEQNNNLAFATRQDVQGPASIRLAQNIDANGADVESHAQPACTDDILTNVSVELLILSFDLADRVQYVQTMLQDLATSLRSTYETHCIVWHLRIRVVFGSSDALLNQVEDAMERVKRPAGNETRSKPVHAARGTSPLGDAAGCAGAALEGLLNAGSRTEQHAPLSFDSTTKGKTGICGNVAETPGSTPAADIAADDQRALDALAQVVRTAQHLWSRHWPSEEYLNLSHRVSLTGAPAPRSLGVSFPWFVRSRYLVRSALADDGPSDVMMMQEDDTAISMHHVLHMMLRINGRWMDGHFVAKIDTAEGRGIAVALQRLPEMILPVPVLIEDALVGERCLYNRTSWLREALGDQPIVESCDHVRPADPASPSSMMPGLTLQLSNGWPVYRIRHYKDGNAQSRHNTAFEDQWVSAPYNMHFAGTMLPGKLLVHLAMETKCIDPRVPLLPHWQYPPIDRSQDQPYTICGFSSVFDLPPVGSVLGDDAWQRWARSVTIWHRPNKYVGRHVWLQRTDAERTAAAMYLTGLSPPQGLGSPLSGLPGGFHEFGPSWPDLVGKMVAIRDSHEGLGTMRKMQVD